ncbi:MAG: C-terminal oligomerization domain, partial [Pseudomonadota bacterium]
LELNNIHYNDNQFNNFSADFLMQQMDYHEQIEQNLTNLVELQRLEERLQQQQDLIIEKLVKTFANKNYIDACKLTKELAFYQKLAESVDSAISSLDE